MNMLTKSTKKTWGHLWCLENCANLQKTSKIFFLFPDLTSAKVWHCKELELDELNLFHNKYILKSKKNNYKTNVGFGTHSRTKGLVGEHTNSIGDCCVCSDVAPITVSYVIRECACHMLQHFGIRKKLSIQLEKKKHYPRLRSDYCFPFHSFLAHFIVCTLLYYIIL